MSQTSTGREGWVGGSTGSSASILAVRASLWKKAPAPKSERRSTQRPVGFMCGTTRHVRLRERTDDHEHNNIQRQREEADIDVLGRVGEEWKHLSDAQVHGRGRRSEERRVGK